MPGHRRVTNESNKREMPGVRIDRWLWAARFFKTRSLAKGAVEGGKVQLEGQRVKPAKDLRIGQTLDIRRGDVQLIVIVKALSEQRGPARVAQTLYEETPESVEAREARSAQRRMERAGLTIPATKPSKRQRREIAKLRELDDTSSSSESSSSE
jgi:ribosome-associated heat shock protein Hsp15